MKGSPTDSACNVLHNCVGYAFGRFNEIVGEGSCKHLRPVNAENFLQYKGDLQTGTVPRLGACMVWQKGATLTGSDGAGHVAIVEQIISDTEIVTSESGWNASKPFWTQNRRKGSDGNWGQGTGYKFLGFIYNPAECCQGAGQAAGGESGSASTGSQPVGSGIQVGSRVRVKSGAKTYDGVTLASFVFANVYDVIQINGDRVVIGKGKAVTAAMYMKDLTLE